MSIQHANIPDANLHEPKGVVAAASNTFYRANGAGSGTWGKIGIADLAALTTDGGSSNKKIITNGSGGFQLKADAVYGTMAITNNTNGFAVAAATDGTLNTNSDYVLFTGTGAPWASENLNEITFNTNRIIVPYTGIYEIQAWANVTGYPTNTASVAIKYRVNGTTFGPRKVKTKSNSAGDAGNLTGFGLFPCVAGDFIQLYVASTNAGSLIISDCNILIKLINQTA